MFGSIWNANKAKNKLKKKFLIDEQKFIMRKIKEETNRGYETLSLEDNQFSDAMTRRAVSYIKATKGDWLIELGYEIEWIEPKWVIIKWFRQ